MKAKLIKFPTFTVNIKEKTGDVELHHLDPTLEYQQNDSDSYCWVIFASAWTGSEFFVPVKDIAGRIDESLNC